MTPYTRYYCEHCGIVRDRLSVVTDRAAPLCRHNALDVAATRMIPIPSYHPLAEGVLPWGTGDPTRSVAS